MRHNVLVPGPKLLQPLTLLLLALLGCGDIKLEAGEILHPTPENAPPAGASLITTDTVPAGLSEEALSAWRGARDRLLNATTVLALGTDDEEGPELFGMIGDVALDAENNLLVADAADYSVRIFGPDGSHVASFGREGEGPMEFSGTLHSIGALGDGRVLVGTRGSTKIFGPAADGYQHLETVSVYSDHFCLSADERMFTANHDRQSDRVLHAATGHGALISEDLPQIREIAGGRIVVAWDDPYPRLEVRALGGGEGGG